MSKIKNDSTVEDAIVELCEGNPGAIGVLAGLVTANKVRGMLLLDKYGIYGSKISMLAKVCGDLDVIDQVLEYIELGFLDVENVLKVIEQYKEVEKLGLSIEEKLICFIEGKVEKKIASGEVAG